MAGKVINLSFVLLSKFGASRQESASKTATSHIRKTLCVSVKKPTRKWHIWFLPTHEPTLKKPKEPFFANARTNEPTIKSKFDD